MDAHGRTAVPLTDRIDQLDASISAFVPEQDRPGRLAGVIANAPSFDTLGLYAADVAGVALAAGAVRDDWTPVTPGGARPPALGIPAGPYLECAGPETLDAFDAQVKLLRAAGFDVRRAVADSGRC